MSDTERAVLADALRILEADRDSIARAIEAIRSMLAAPASRTEETPAKGTPCHYCSGWVGHPNRHEACIRDPVRCVGMPGYTGATRAAEPNGSEEGA